MYAKGQMLAFTVKNTVDHCCSAAAAAAAAAAALLIFMCYSAPKEG